MAGVGVYGSVQRSRLSMDHPYRPTRQAYEFVLNLWVARRFLRDYRVMEPLSCTGYACAD